MSCEPTDDENLRAQTLGWGFSLKLSLYFAIVFTIGALGLLFIGYHFIASAFESREILTVEERLRDYRAWLLQEGEPLLEMRFQEEVRGSPDEMFLRLMLHNNRQALLTSSPRCDRLLDETVLQNLPPFTREAGLYLGGENDKCLWAVSSLDVGDGRVLQAGKSLHSGEEVLERFRKMFLLGVLPALFVGVVGGTLMTYKAIGPIRALVTTIQGILRTGDLSRRAKPLKGRDELNALVNAFNRLLGRQERLINSMHTSLDSVAHDLRTPMARLRNTAERALQNPEDSEAKTEALADCLEESDHVLSMLRTMMELSEAECGAMRLRMESLSLEEVLSNVVELYEFVAEEKGVTLVLEPISDDVVLVADRTRLLQLFANLLDNAIKYSPKGTAVIVGAGREGDTVVAWVQDRGSGIREGDLPKIWERLFRGDPSRSTRGVGLGLSFVKAIAEAHGGKAEVKSRVDVGSRFVVRLPLKPPPEAGEMIDSEAVPS